MAISSKRPSGTPFNETSASITPAQNLDEGTYWKVFAILVVIGFLTRLACFTGLIGSDDLGYSHYAQLTAHFSYRPELSQFALRFGVFVPVAIVYRLFGITEWTTVVVPLLASTASVAMLMLVGRKLMSSRAALIAGFLLATFPADIRFATILVPEPIAGAWILVAVLTYLYWGEGDPVRSGLVAGVCIGLAYLSKEPSLFVGPALMIDALVRRRWSIFSGIAAGMLLVLGAEHIYYVAAAGDFLFRPHAMAEHNGSHYMASVNQHLWWRLFVVYPKLMLLPNRSFGLHSLFAIALTIIGFFVLKAERLRLPLLWASIPWIYLNFGTSSLTRYWALPADDRYILFVYPPLFLLSAEIVVRIMAYRPHVTPLLRVALSVVAISGFYVGFVNRAHGWRTEAVRELRDIAHQAEIRNIHTVAMAPDDPEPWWPVLAILDQNLHESDNGGAADILIRPDAFDLPTVVSVSPP